MRVICSIVVYMLKEETLNIIINMKSMKPDPVLDYLHLHSLLNIPITSYN